MKKRIMGLIAIAAVGAFCVLALAGCGCSSEVVVTSSDVTGGITVTASSDVKVVPDKASFEVAVTSEGETADAVQEENAKKVNAVTKALLGLGVGEKSVQTTNTYLNPLYDYSNEIAFSDDSESVRIIGYEMTTSLEISDLDVDKVGEVLQACVKAGANNAGGIQYYSSNYDERYREALTQAMTEARVKAETLAKAGGVDLGSVISVSEGYENQSYRYDTGNAVMAMEDAAESEMKVMPGEVEVSASVTVTYAVK